MIDVCVTSCGEHSYRRIDCSGHAGFAEGGKDIVCASVSILVINTVNSIETFTKCKVIEAEEDSVNGRASVIFPDGTEEDATLLIDSMLLGIKSIEKQYGSKFVKLTEVKE